MTTLTIELPDSIVREAQDAGLLAPEARAQRLKDAVRRQAGQRLLEAAKRIHAADVPPISEEEIVAEVKAVRAERQSRQTKADKQSQADTGSRVNAEALNDEKGKLCSQTQQIS